MCVLSLSKTLVKQRKTIQYKLDITLYKHNMWTAASKWQVCVQLPYTGNNQKYSKTSCLTGSGKERGEVRTF